MSKSAFSDAHQILVEHLTAARIQSGIKQADLAALIGKNQSYISNIERGQRRVDLLEFYALSKAMRVDPAALAQEIFARFPNEVTI